MQSSQWNIFWSVKVLLSVVKVQLFTFYLYFKYNCLLFTCTSSTIVYFLLVLQVQFSLSTFTSTWVAFLRVFYDVLLLKYINSVLLPALTYIHSLHADTVVQCTCIRQQPEPERTGGVSPKKTNRCTVFQFRVKRYSCLVIDMWNISQLGVEPSNLQSRARYEPIGWGTATQPPRDDLPATLPYTGDCSQMKIALCKQLRRIQ